MTPPSRPTDPGPPLTGGRGAVTPARGRATGRRKGGRRRVVALVAALAVAAIGAAWYGQRVRERGVSADLDAARRDRGQGLVASATLRLRRLAEAYPGRGDVWFELGLCEAAWGREDA